MSRPTTELPIGRQILPNGVLGNQQFLDSPRGNGIIVGGTREQRIKLIVLPWAKKLVNAGSSVIVTDPTETIFSIISTCPTWHGCPIWNAPGGNLDKLRLVEIYENPTLLVLSGNATRIASELQSAFARARNSSSSIPVIFLLEGAADYRIDWPQVFLVERGNRHSIYLLSDNVADFQEASRLLLNSALKIHLGNPFKNMEDSGKYFVDLAGNKKIGDSVVSSLERALPNSPHVKTPCLCLQKTKELVWTDISSNSS